MKQFVRKLIYVSFNFSLVICYQKHWSWSCFKKSWGFLTLFWCLECLHVVKISLNNFRSERGSQITRTTCLIYQWTVRSDLPLWIVKTGARVSDFYGSVIEVRKISLFPNEFQSLNVQKSIFMFQQNNLLKWIHFQLVCLLLTFLYENRGWEREKFPCEPNRSN